MTQHAPKGTHGRTWRWRHLPLKNIKGPKLVFIERYRKTRFSSISQLELRSEDSMHLLWKKITQSSNWTTRASTAGIMRGQIKGNLRNTRLAHKLSMAHKFHCTDKQLTSFWFVPLNHLHRQNKLSNAECSKTMADNLHCIALIKKFERKRKLPTIQDESIKNNSKQKEIYVHRSMISCGRIKTTNNYVCVIKQENYIQITFKMQLG